MEKRKNQENRLPHSAQFSQAKEDFSYSFFAPLACFLDFQKAIFFKNSSFVKINIERYKSAHKTTDRTLLIRIEIAPSKEINCFTASTTGIKRKLVIRYLKLFFENIEKLNP
ncbi:MAG TPA: hypothetical protein PKV22_07760, partial [Paludibacteraceae bacterium]|nr:hypothetical protein [Paludibacteraceae bacterium]